MSVITIPEIKAGSASFELIRNDTPIQFLNGAEVFVENRVALWRYGINLVTQTYEQGQAWTAALVQLARMGNTFKASPPGFEGALYSGGGPLLVNGLPPSSNSLNCDGADNNVTVLRAGEFFEVNGELKLVVSDAESNGAGQLTVTFEPPLREAPPDNDPLDISTPKAEFRLINPRTGWTMVPKRFTQIQIDAIETHG